jgi:indolepyruvate ferredoxin oxidoreductase alpha subunit
VKWLRTVPSYEVDVATHAAPAMTTEDAGLKVIIADGECQLERSAAASPGRLACSRRARRGAQFGVDDDVCTGDHSCIRLSGCPTLT